MEPREKEGAVSPVSFRDILGFEEFASWVLMNFALELPES